MLESPATAEVVVDEEDWSGNAATAELIRGLGTVTVICGILMVVLGLPGLLDPSRVLFLDPLVAELLEIAEAILTGFSRATVGSLVR